MYQSGTSLPRPGTSRSSKATATRRPFVGGLLASVLVSGLLIAGSTPASAQQTEHVSAQRSACSTDAKCRTPKVRPPVLGKARSTCFDSAATVEARLRNPNRATMDYMVGLSGGDFQETYVMTLSPRSSDRVRFDGVPNGTFLLQVQNDVGDVVAHTQLTVNCPAPAVHQA